MTTTSRRATTSVQNVVSDDSRSIISGSGKRHPPARKKADAVGHLSPPPSHILSISVKISIFDGEQEYDITMRTELDIIAEKAYAREEGLEEGRVEGRAEGRAEEQINFLKKEEVAIRSLKEQGVADEIIAKSFGKTVQQIQNI